MLPKLLVALALVSVAACASDPPPPTPPPTPSSPSSSPLPTASPPPTGSPVPPTGSPVPPPPTPTPPPASAIDWSAVALPVTTGYSLVGAIDVAYHDGQFVVVGTGWQEDDRGVQANVPFFWLSRDGRQWELVVDQEWPGGYIEALAVWQGRLLAAGYVGDERASLALWTSTDGRAWERLADRPAFEFFRGATEGRDIVSGGISSVVVDGDELAVRGWLYCACQSEVRDATVEWRTRDGEEWERRELPADAGMPPISGGPGWLRVAPDGSSIESSVDGSAWRAAWLPPPTTEGEPRSAQLFSLDRAADGWLAVGVLIDDGVSRPLALTSSDGLAWSESGAPPTEGQPGAMLAFADAGGLIVAIGRLADPAQPYAWVGQAVGVTLLQRERAAASRAGRPGAHTFGP